jgi:hypothetical protein
VEYTIGFGVPACGACAAAAFLAPCASFCALATTATPSMKIKVKAIRIDLVFMFGFIYLQINLGFRFKGLIRARDWAIDQIIAYSFGRSLIR